MNVNHYRPQYMKVEAYGRTQDYAVAVSGGSVNVSAVAGDTLDFYFPKGCIDLSSLHMLFRYMCLPFGSAKSGTSQIVPRDAECLLQSLEVYLGGTKMNYINNYGQIFNLLSTYAFGAEHQIYRGSYRNNWVNGRVGAVVNLDGVQFCMQKWLGLLGLPMVLDTNKLGQLHIRLTLGPSWITNTNSGNHSWGIYDTYMKVKYIENYQGEMPRYLEWDDYKSLATREGTHNFTMTMKVFSSKIDWALCKILNKILRADHRAKTGIDGNFNTTQAFYGPSLGQVLAWNIAVNDMNVFKYKATPADALLALHDIFGNKMSNTGILADNNTNTYERIFAGGAKLDFANEVPQDVEITYTNEGVTNQGCFPVMIVKTTSAMEIGANGDFRVRT